MDEKSLVKAAQDMPYPGMREAFESHFGQSWTDRDWRSETSVWAAAWKAALRTKNEEKPLDESARCKECGSFACGGECVRRYEHE